MIREWAQRIARADVLAAEQGPAASLVRFYGCLLREQARVFDALDAANLTGTLEADVGSVLERGTDLLRTVSEQAPDQLALAGRAWLEGPLTLRQGELLTYWRTRSDRSFFPKALLQPYAEWVMRHRAEAEANAPASTDHACPHCGGAPQLSILAGAAPTATDGGGARYLQCATCLATWLFRRVVCPSCGNEDERTLGYYQSPTFPHVRVDACERCGRYLKSIDLTTLGLAVPLVDEVAAAPLDLWAQEHGYQKIALNLVGL